MKLAFFFERAAITPDSFGEPTEEQRRRAISYKAETNLQPVATLDDIFDEIKPIEVPKRRMLASSIPISVTAWRKYVASMPAP